MNTKQFFSALAFTAVGIATSAQAENYDGVVTIRSERPRADLAAEAREAARNPIAGEASFVSKIDVPNERLARAEVRNAALSIARAGNPYGDNAGAGVLGLTSGPATHKSLEPQARKTPDANRNRASGG